ncbi:MAG: hypothetical protein AB7S38_25250 [Vulcanimicrobiota bacterium]
MQPTPISYRCDMSDTRRRRVGVEMKVDLPDQGPLEVYLPQFSPGSSVASQGHPADLLHLRFTDAAGENMPYQRTGKGCKVEAKGPVTVHYTIRAEEFSDVGAQLTDEHAYLNGPATLMCVRGHESDTPATLSFENLPGADWKSSSTLPRVEGAEHTFYAASYADLADDNVMLGHFDEAREKVGDTSIIVTQKGTGPYKNLPSPGATPAENAHDFARIYRAFLHNFGEFPSQRFEIDGARPAGVCGCDNYVIHKHYLHGGPDKSDGFEHFRGHELIRHVDNESYIAGSFDGSARMNENYTMAHEVTHKLLAKYVQHEGIDAADLSQNRPTDGLWVTEGVTNWVGYLLERQSGLISPEQYMKRWEGAIETYYQDYAQNPSNPRDDSLEAHLGNIKYYNKGSLVALALDLELRQRSNNEVGMLDVLRNLKREFGGSGNYHSLEDMQRLVGDVAAPHQGGRAWVDRFFADHLVDRQRIDLSQYLGHAGYQVVERSDDWRPGLLNLPGARLRSDNHGAPYLEADPRVSAEEKSFPLPFPALGLTLDQDLTLSRVRDDGPAFDAGLKWFEGKKPEQVLLRGPQGEVDLKAPRDIREVEAMVFRFEETSVFDGSSRTKTIVVPVGAANKLTVEEVPNPTSEQLALREKWMSQLPEEILSGH